MVTLMACYGGPTDETDDSACNTAKALDSNGHGSGQTLPVRGEGVQGSCVQGTSSAVYSYKAFNSGSLSGKQGTFSVSWTSDVPVGVYIGDYCNAGDELACKPAALNGKLEYQTDSLKPMLVFVTVNGDAVANYQIDVSFEPCGTADAPCPAK